MLRQLTDSKTSLLRRSTQSSLVDVSFSSPSPEISAKVTNLWAEEFIAAQITQSVSEPTSMRVNSSTNQIAKLRKRLSFFERELVQFANANEILVLEAGGERQGSETARRP